ncbi:MAG: carboxypeptidase regulatory-like domain-containing protein [Bacteroidetes bacterium]|nr:carboxypeptidase regulatory-like domain-containing protein [Bacteroidota bacterium]
MWCKTYKTTILTGLIALVSLSACKKSDDNVYPQSGVIATGNNALPSVNKPVDINATTGQITGTVLPADAQPIVKAVQLDQVFTAMPDKSGNFVLSVPKGTYTITFSSMTGTYKDASVGNVQVMNGASVSVGTVILSRQ